jgi:hypothetical protein
MKKVSLNILWNFSWNVFMKCFHETFSWNVMKFYEIPWNFMKHYMKLVLMKKTFCQSFINLSFMKFHDFMKFQGFDKAYIQSTESTM